MQIQKTENPVAIVLCIDSVPLNDYRSSSFYIILRIGIYQIMVSKAGCCIPLNSIEWPAWQPGTLAKLANLESRHILAAHLSGIDLIGSIGKPWWANIDIE